uniref:BCL2 associated agonist of cell death n=1 Tax=Xenopus tropicalis TaxID=8364 RepID=A0A6I8PXS6_XENTR
MADSSPSAVFKLEEFDNEEQGLPLPFVDPPRGAGVRQPVAKSSPSLRRYPGKESRLRTESASESSETDKVGELHPFRSRSRSAPSSMIATKYGRELRRMSDEFEKSFTICKDHHRSTGLCTHLCFGKFEWKCKLLHTKMPAGQRCRCLGCTNHQRIVVYKAAEENK